METRELEYQGEKLKMAFWKSGSLVLVLIGLVLLLTACGEFAVTSVFVPITHLGLAGKWQQTACVSNSCNIEFVSDGQTSPDGTVKIGNITSRYTWLDDKRLKTQLPGVSAANIYTVSESGNTLTLTPEAQGQPPLTFQRNP